MRIAAWLYYLLDRRIGKPQRFDRLYTLDADPFGLELFTYEKEKNANLLSLLDGKHFSHILDVGCGGGTLTRMLSAFAEKITAIDFSAKAIDRATSYPNNPRHITYACCSIRNIDLSKKYNLIICSEVLYYLTGDELTAFIENLCASQSSGTLFVTAGKARETFIPKIVTKYLSLIQQIIRNDNRRPYVINVYIIP